MSLYTFLQALQDDMGALSGIRAAPDDLQEGVNNPPVIYSYARSGRFVIEPAGAMTGLHTIVVELHYSRKDSARDYFAIMAYLETIANALAKPVGTSGGDSFAGTIQTFGDITYTLKSWEWGPGVKTFGIEFVITDVKIQQAIT